MKISEEYRVKLLGSIAAMRNDRLPHWRGWRDLADYILPKRYTWLLSDTERQTRNSRNPMILDSTGTKAARTLASGMMNGITSPSRPWFKLRIAGFTEEMDYEVRVWLDEVERRMMLILAESNFYNAMAVMYLDLCVFGTAAMLIYEDFESVIRCYNPALGEFYIAQSYRLQVNTFAREFSYKVHQVVAQFGIENCTQQTQELYRQGGANLQKDLNIVHLIEPNDGKVEGVGKNFDFREVYWEQSCSSAEVLSLKGFHEMPGIFPRYELTGNDSYGTSPGNDALGDIIQLQQETKRKAQGLDKMISPPVIADIQLQNRPTALMPNGVTYVSGQNNAGIKPAYQVNIPIGELVLDIREVQGRIRETFHNDLFKMISQLETVRTATEIDARREEKLVLLGSVLERFENEALDPALTRIFAIMQRKKLLPEAPEILQGADLQIQYVSILTSAQRAVGVGPVERWLQVIGNVSAIYPGAINVPNWDELLRNYGRDIGVSARDINPPEATNQLNQQAQELQATREAAATGDVLVNSAKQLSETDVGGGANALQQLLAG